MATPSIKNGEQSHLTMMFNGEYLFLRNIRFLKGRTEQFKAASGNARKAPIPVGSYWVQADETHALTGRDDWTTKGVAMAEFFKRGQLSDGINVLVSFLKKEHPETAPYWIELLVVRAA